MKRATIANDFVVLEINARHGKRETIVVTHAEANKLAHEILDAFSHRDDHQVNVGIDLRILGQRNDS